jgi:hypothetical protein
MRSLPCFALTNLGRQMRPRWTGAEFRNFQEESIDSRQQALPPRRCFTSRPISLCLALAMVGCAQHVTPFASTASQPTMPNAGAIAIKPAESVTAYVAFKNDTLNASEFFVYWSYAANPFWHQEVRACILPGGKFDTKIAYNHIKEGPQIKFGTITALSYDGCPWAGASPLTVAFHRMNFDPDAYFDVDYRFKRQGLVYTLCARGGGNNEVCHSR